MKNSIDNPGSEFIQTKASKYGLVAVTEEEYDSLTDPTKESLIENASKLGLSVIEKLELELLRSKLIILVLST